MHCHQNAEKERNTTLSRKPTSQNMHQNTMDQKQLRRSRTLQYINQKKRHVEDIKPWLQIKSDIRIIKTKERKKQKQP